MSSPKIIEPKKDNSDNQIGNDAIEAPERCGYCSKQKRSENKDELSVSTGEEVCKCPNASDSTDSSIRLGAVPASAFRRSPSPRPSLAPPPSPCTGTETVTASDLVGGLASKFEIISVREKHGEFRKAIPHMPLPLAILLCLFNVVLPGTGTFLSSFTVLCGCPCEHEQRSQSVGYNMLAALLQLLTAPIIVGWIWSVLWGITFVNISVSKEVGESNTNTSTMI